MIEFPHILKQNIQYPSQGEDLINEQQEYQVHKTSSFGSDHRGLIEAFNLD